MSRSGVGSLRFAGVSKRYRAQQSTKDDVVALDDVSFAIGRDEAVGLIGPNGAGKSTVLKLAAGVSGPTSGRIVRSGHTVTVIELGAGVQPDLTGRENIELLMALTTHGRRRASGWFDAVVEFSELGAVLDRPTRHYSTGMLARLSFSVAAHSEPDLLLVDEVLSVGDLAFQERCSSRIFGLREAGTTVVVVSHDLGLIADTCDRSILLVRGRIELDDDTDTVVGHYLGEPPNARRTAGGPQLRLRTNRLRSGEPVDLELELPPGPEVGALRFDFVVPTHPTLQANGHGRSMVCGSVRTAPPTDGQAVVQLTTESLPEGRYELHVVMESPDARVLGSSVESFTLSGPRGPFAIRLDGTWTIDGAPVEPPDGVMAR